MEENFKNIEDILENPGILIFRLDNQNIVFPPKRHTYTYDNKVVMAIKNNIIEVFQNISQNV